MELAIIVHNLGAAIFVLIMIILVSLVLWKAGI